MTPSSQSQTRTQARRHGHHRHCSGIGRRLLGSGAYRDSRAYLLRDGHLSRITCDHSYVQHLIDTGRITPAEAKNHPQRNVVMRVLGDFDIDPHPDISIRKAHPADRWLLCSDGLCGVLEDSTIKETMTALADQGECAQRLVQMALRAGSTDNVTAVIADATLALDADASICHIRPRWWAAQQPQPGADCRYRQRTGGHAPALRDDHSPAKRAAALMQPADTQHNDAAPASAEPSTTRVVQPSAVREETGERDNPDTGEIPVVQKPDGRLSADPNDPRWPRPSGTSMWSRRKPHVPSISGTDWP